MISTIVFTFIGQDKPGLIEKLSQTVSHYEGNWLDSYMSQLSGQFAGVARVTVAHDKANNLCQALDHLSGDELRILVQPTNNQETPALQTQQIAIIGNDRPGIIKEVSAALAARAINICEMDSYISSAPMTAEPLFHATVMIQVPQTLNLDELTDELDDIANDLTIDISYGNTE